MKNLNSFRSVYRAIKYESERQIEILENGGKIIQETRKWDDNHGKSISMRRKETSSDYRYFPDPDLLAVEISKDDIENTIKTFGKVGKDGMRETDIEILHLMLDA